MEARALRAVAEHAKRGPLSAESAAAYALSFIDGHRDGHGSNKLTNRWFGEGGNYKRIVKGREQLQLELSSGSGSSAIPGGWIVSGVFGCIWSESASESLLWLAVFDGDDDDSPRTGVVGRFTIFYLYVLCP
jgi:hypothetical protein